MSTTTRKLETDLNEVTRKLADVSAEVERLRQELAEVKAASGERELLSRHGRSMRRTPPR